MPSPGEWYRMTKTERRWKDPAHLLEPFLLAEQGNDSLTREVVRIQQDLAGVLADLVPAESLPRVNGLLSGLQEANEERLLSLLQAVRGQALVDGAHLAAALQVQATLEGAGITVKPSPVWGAALDATLAEIHRTDAETSLSVEAKTTLGETPSWYKDTREFFPYAATMAGQWKRRVLRVPTSKGSASTLPLVPLPHLQHTEAGENASAK